MSDRQNCQESGFSSHAPGPFPARGKTPPAGASHAEDGGEFSTACPAASWFLLGFAGGYLRLCDFLVKAGAPGWMVSAPQVLLHLLPAGFRIAAFGAWLQKNEKNGRPA